jgi:hypothetical protein
MSSAAAALLGVTPSILKEEKKKYVQRQRSTGEVAP